MSTRGQYEVQGILGRGATALVELARDPEGRTVAIKRVVLHGSAADIDRARVRIRREAEVLSRIRHPAVLPLLALHDDGTDVVLVTPYATRGTLRDRVLTRGPLPVEEVARIAGPLLDGLAAVHRHGVVHRDISPANVLFTASGAPVLADFGVASQRDQTVGLTGDGWTIGTPGFMAPEQARGEAATPATDIFGLAATLVFALRGVGPFGSGSPELQGWRAAQGDIDPLPPGLPAVMASALAAMLDPEPAHRPSAVAVRGGTTGTMPLPRPAPPSPPASAPSPAPAVSPDPEGPGVRRRWPKVAAALATSIAAAVGVVALARGTGDGSPTGSGTTPRTVASVPCTSLPYKPCSQPQPAPFTDGRHCIANHDDYDGNAANGCEAAPDALDGTTLVIGTPLSANLVPASDTDTYPIHVTDRFQLFCDGTLTIRLTAPRGSVDRVELLRGTTVRASAVSADGVPGTAVFEDPSCGHDDGGWYTVRVSSIAGHSAAPYRLEASGHL